MRYSIQSLFLVALVIAAAFCLGGCSDAQIARLDAAVQQAETLRERATKAEQIATDALARAEQLALVVGNEQANAMIASAKDALDQVHKGRVIADEALEKATAVAVAAKAAHEGGGDTIKVILAGMSSFLLGLGLLFPKLRAATTVVAQLVKGVDGVRDAIGPDAWKEKAAPALRDAQDSATKAQVVAIQTKQKLASA